MNKLKYGTVVKIKGTSSIGNVMVVDELLDNVEVRFPSGEYKHFRMKQLEPYTFEGEEEVMFRDDLKLGKVEQSSLSGATLHKSILDEMHSIFLRKNSDYGNSFSEQFDEYGLLSALIRLDDKMRRLKQLSKQEAQVKDESILDTLIDLSNYSVMTIMELRKNKTNE